MVHCRMTLGMELLGPLRLSLYNFRRVIGAKAKYAVTVDLGYGSLCRVCGTVARVVYCRLCVNGAGYWL